MIDKPRPLGNLTEILCHVSLYVDKITLSSFNIPSKATHGDFTVVRAREVERYLAEVGNLNQECQVFPSQYWYIISFNMEV